MDRTRRLFPTLAALLAVLVVVQTTDIIACADEAVAAEHSEAHADPASSGGHPAPVPGDSDDGHDHDDETSADCLCHVVFAPTAIVPDVGAPPAPTSGQLASNMVAPPEVEQSGLDHVPLG